MHFKHRGRSSDRRNLRVDGLLVVAGQEVVTIVARFGSAAARILDLDHVDSDPLDQVLNVVLAGQADGRDQDQGCGTDDHAEGGQGKADLVGAKAVERQPQNLAEQHGPFGARQSALECKISSLRDCHVCL